MRSAIDEALDRLYGIGARLPETIGGYYKHWLRRHPRSDRTDKTNADRISYVLDVELEGRALRDWEFDELRRRQALSLLDHMLRVEGRAARGAPGDPKLGKAAFYAYPAPASFADGTLSAAARWNAELGLYVLDWDDVRASDDLHVFALEFARSAFQHACLVCGWG